MSDVFELPVIKGEAVAQSCVRVCDGGGGFSVVNEFAAPFVIKAINNHDRLEQENAELRELATMVVNLSKISDVPISITSKAKQLLNK